MCVAVRAVVDGEAMVVQDVSADQPALVHPADLAGVDDVDVLVSASSDDLARRLDGGWHAFDAVLALLLHVDHKECELLAVHEGPSLSRANRTAPRSRQVSLIAAPRSNSSTRPAGVMQPTDRFPPGG